MCLLHFIGNREAAWHMSGELEVFGLEIYTWGEFEGHQRMSVEGAVLSHLGSEERRQVWPGMEEGNQDR